MMVKKFNKIVEFLLGMGPKSPDVIQVPEVGDGGKWALGEYGFLPLCHVDVSVCGGEFFTHGSALGL